jgi:hypothetical protein
VRLHGGQGGAARQMLAAAIALTGTDVS